MTYVLVVSILCCSGFKNERWTHKWRQQHGRIRVSSAHPLLKTSIWTTIHVQKYLDKSYEFQVKDLGRSPEIRKKYIGEDRKDNFILTTCSWSFAWKETVFLWRESKISDKASTEPSKCQVTLCGLRLQVCSQKSRYLAHVCIRLDSMLASKHSITRFTPKSTWHLVSSQWCRVQAACADSGARPSTLDPSARPTHRSKTKAFSRGLRF